MYTYAGSSVRRVSGALFIIGSLTLALFLGTASFAHAATLSIVDQYSHSTQYYFPIGAKSWSIPDGSMFTGLSGEFWTKTATNDFNIALMRLEQTPKGAGNVCPPSNSWWINYQGDWGALANTFPGPDYFLGNAILKRPNAGEVHMPMNYTLPAGYGMPIENCVWLMLNGSALIAGGAYTMGANLQLQYETGAAAAALTPLQTTIVDDEQCYGLNGCGPYHTYDNSLQFIKVVKFNTDTAILAMNGNSGHSTLASGPFLNWFSGSQATGSWSVTDNFYVVPSCSALPNGNQTADNWEAKLPANKTLFYTRTLGSTGVDVKQNPINQTFSPTVKVPAGGCVVHLVKRTGGGSLNTETQVLLFTQQKLNSKHISTNIPTTMEAGKTYPVTVTVKNQGYGTWTVADGDYLGITGGAMWGIGVVKVPQSVAEKGTATFTFSVKATTTPGVYKFGTRMLRKGAQWHGDEPFVNITVTPAPPTSAPVVTLTANPASVVSGSASMLTWTSTNATSCTASSAWTGTKALNGSQSTGALTATKTYTLTCTGAGGTTTKSATVTVTPAPVANNAQFISQNVPSTMQAGKTYSATVTFKNTGTATWTAGTNYKLGSQNPQDNTVWGVGRWALPQSVAPGASVTIPVALKAPAAAGTYNFQVQILREWVQWFGAKSTNVAVTVSNPAAPVVTLTANPPSVVSGGASTLTWSTTNATSCTASGAWTGAKALNGTQSTGALTAAKTYTLSCTGAGGTTVKSVTVAVTAQPVPPMLTFIASTTSVVSGGGTTLSWSSANATACTASGGWTGAKPVSGNQALANLTATAVYTLSCSGPGGSIAKSVTITVTPKPAAPIVTLTAIPTSVVSGSASMLTWTSTNATSCTASSAWTGTKALNGSQSTGALTATKTYTLTCTGAGGTAVKSVTVSITPRPGVCGVGMVWDDDACATVPLTGDGNPTGYFDGLLSTATAPTLYGWVYDPKAPSASVAVHIYVDGPASFANNYANFAAAVVANTSRPDVNAARNITGNHGWQWVIPEKYRTGAHTFYIYGINLQQGGANPQLLNSPRTIRVTQDGSVFGQQEKSACWALAALSVDTLMECFGY